MKTFLYYCSIPWVLLAQRPIVISTFNEATAIPYTTFITTPIHPGVQLGTEFNYTQKTKTRWLQTANISYFYHNHLAQGIAAYTEVAYEYRTQWGLAAQPLLGIGYLHTFSTQDEFSFSKGSYKKKADRGNSRLYPTLSLDLGYYIKAAHKHSPKIFVRYQSWLEYPYSPDFIPVMPHINLHLGIKFFINVPHEDHP